MLEAEHELIENAKAGDNAAFGRLYDHYIVQIYRFIAIKVGTKEIAEDLAHDVFMSAWQKLPNFKHQGFPFSSWLYTIARNRVIDHYRTKKSHLNIDDEAVLASNLLQSPSDSESLADVSLALSKVSAALLQLNEEQREIITMRFVSDLSPAEIAQILDKREGTVRIIQHRAITKLKKLLEKHPTD